MDTWEDIQRMRTRVDVIGMEELIVQYDGLNCVDLKNEYYDAGDVQFWFEAQRVQISETIDEFMTMLTGRLSYSASSTAEDPGVVLREIGAYLRGINAEGNVAMQIHILANGWEVCRNLIDHVASDDSGRMREIGLADPQLIRFDESGVCLDIQTVRALAHV